VSAYHKLLSGCVEKNDLNGVIEAISAISGLRLAEGDVLGATYFARGLCATVERDLATALSAVDRLRREHEQFSKAYNMLVGAK
jgi:hypothetical protein